MPIITPFVGVLVPYTHIFAAVLSIPSTTGKRTAFSTCGSISLWCYSSVGCSLGFISDPHPPTWPEKHGSCSDERCDHSRVELLHLQSTQQQHEGRLGGPRQQKASFCSMTTARGCLSVCTECPSVLNLPPWSQS